MCCYPDGCIFYLIVFMYLKGWGGGEGVISPPTPSPIDLFCSIHFFLHKQGKKGQEYAFIKKAVMSNSRRQRETKLSTCRPFSSALVFQRKCVACEVEFSTQTQVERCRMWTELTR